MIGGTLDLIGGFAKNLHVVQATACDAKAVILTAHGSPSSSSLLHHRCWRAVVATEVSGPLTAAAALALASRSDSVPAGKEHRKGIFSVEHALDM